MDKRIKKKNTPLGSIHPAHVLTKCYVVYFHPHLYVLEGRVVELGMKILLSSQVSLLSLSLWASGQSTKNRDHTSLCSRYQNLHHYIYNLNKFLFLLHLHKALADDWQPEIQATLSMAKSSLSMQIREQAGVSSAQHRDILTIGQTHFHEEAHSLQTNLTSSLNLLLFFTIKANKLLIWSLGLTWRLSRPPHSL